MSGWGKAGVRLTPEQQATRRREAAQWAMHAAADKERWEAIGRRKWAAGFVVPYLITVALDADGLYGPEVDRACRAEEPDVDLWEAGKLYPRWDQLQALAELTGKTCAWFCELPGSVDTSLRFHLPRHEHVHTRPITRYSDAVVARCPGTDAT